MNRLILFISVIPCFVYGQQSFVSSSETAEYYQAKKASHKIEFVMKHRQLGLFSSKFSGFAKKFSAKAKIKDEIVHTLEITIDKSNMDTDNGMRNEKMHNDCLKVSDYPAIEIKLQSPFKIQQPSKKIAAKIKVFEDWEDIEIMGIEVSKNEKGYEVSGAAPISIKKLKIPDPSIAVAKFYDRVDVKFRLNFTNENSPTPQ